MTVLSLNTWYYCTHDFSKVATLMQWEEKQWQIFQSSTWSVTFCSAHYSLWSTFSLFVIILLSVSSFIELKKKEWCKPCLCSLLIFNAAFSLETVRQATADWLMMSVKKNSEPVKKVTLITVHLREFTDIYISHHSLFDWGLWICIYQHVEHFCFSNPNRHIYFSVAQRVTKLSQPGGLMTFYEGSTVETQGNKPGIAESLLMTPCLNLSVLNEAILQELCHRMVPPPTPPALLCLSLWQF